jgi:hypothetical protein
LIVWDLCAESWFVSPAVDAFGGDSLAIVSSPWESLIPASASPVGVAVDRATGDLWITQAAWNATLASDLVRVSFSGAVVAVATHSIGFFASCIAVDSNATNAARAVYLCDAANARIVAFAPTTNATTIVAGTTGLVARGIAVDSTAVGGGGGGSVLYVSCGDHVIRRVAIGGGNFVVTTILAGSAGMGGFANGIGVAASFWAPRGLALSANGARLFVTDAFNHRVRAVDTATGAVTTLAGSGASLPLDAAVGADAGLCGPESIAVVADGAAGGSRETLVVGDRCSGRLRRIDTATGAVATIAGASSAGYFASGVGTNAAFADLVSVAADARGNLFVVDGGSGSGSGSTNGASGSGSASVDSAPQSRRMRYRLVQSALPCPAGSVCGAAVSRPASCPAGAFCGTTGLSAISGAGSGGCTVSGLGLNSCLGSGVCPIGAYCASGSIAPAACPLGAVCATTGMSAPALCRAGAYCNATGLRHV